MSMFPGPGAQVYYNEAGEPLGWDYPNTDPPKPSDEDDRNADYVDALAEEAYEYGKEAEAGDANPYVGEDKHLAATWQAGYDDGHPTLWIVIDTKTGEVWPEKYPSRAACEDVITDLDRFQPEPDPDTA